MEEVQLKILVLATTFPRWNSDTTPAFVYELSIRLQQKGYQIIVLAPHHDGAKKFEIWDGMEIHRFRYFWPYKYQKVAYNGGIISNLGKSWIAWIQLPFFLICELFSTITIIHKEKIDLIHSHWIIPCGVCGAICKILFKVRHITTAHAGDVFTVKNSALKLLATFTMRNADIITANSRYTHQVLKFIDDDCSDKIAVVPMGVDLVRFQPSRSSNFKDLLNAEYIVLSVGRLVKKKGLDNLIRAMAIVTRAFPSVKLVIGGSGPEEANLRQLVKEQNLNKNIIFTGFISVEDLPTYYASADIFVLPSVETKSGDTEGLGVVLLEAMASGIAVIGSDIGGITDIISHGYNGLLAKPGDSDDIAEKIIELIADPQKRELIAFHGHNTVVDKFSWDSITEQFIGVFKRC